MTDLQNEFISMATKAAECASWLAGQGIGPDIVYRPGASIVGVCRAHIEGDRWQPDPDGKPVLVSPVTYETRACCLDLIDLVGWWAESGSDLTSVKRMKSLSARFPIWEPSLRAFATMALQAGDRRWQSHADPGLVEWRPGKGPPSPSLAADSTLWLRLRAAFGIRA